MDIEALQRELRQFAAERQWLPFHTPKNLAMALMVEAAELVEIFQWMTPEASRDVRGDTAIRQHVGEELADVLLYLLQMADHTGIDLQHAVRDKLARNARKYPAAWKAGLDRPVASAAAGSVAMPVTHVLLDYENVQPTEQELREMVPEATDVWVFHGPHQNQQLIRQRFASYGADMTPVPISKTGKNALDFHLSFYMGYIASRNEKASLVVVANDTGYEPVLEHAKAMGFATRQIGHARGRRSSAKTPARKVVAKKTTSAGKTAAPKTLPLEPSASADTGARPSRGSGQRRAAAPGAPVGKAAPTPRLSPPAAATFEPPAMAPSAPSPRPSREASPRSRARSRQASASVSAPPLSPVPPLPPLSPRTLPTSSSSSSRTTSQPAPLPSPTRPPSPLRARSTRSQSGPPPSSPPTKQVARKRAAAKEVAAGDLPPAAKKASRKAASARGEAPAPPASASHHAPAAKTVPGALHKLVENLRKMGVKRPVKVSSLKRAMKSFLGAASSPEAVEAAFGQLLDAGDVVIAPNGEATYPRLAQVV